MRKDILYSLLLTVIIFLLNFSLRTMIYFDGETITSSYYLHLTEFPFKLRPFTNMSMFFLTKCFNISLYHSFIIHQYILLSAFFISFAYFLKTINFELKERLIGLSITAFLFPILCIHFVPVFSWDDIWAYICIVWFLNFIIKDNFYTASLFLAVSMVSRESMVLVLPAYYIFRNKDRSNIKWLIPMILPVFIYGLIRCLFFPEVLEGRLTRFMVNFEDIDTVRQTIYSLFVSFGWMWTVLLLGAKNSSLIPAQNKLSEKFRTSAIIVSILTIIIVLNTALARETRLLFTPFIFIIPFVLLQLAWYQKKFYDVLKRMKKSMSIIMILGILLFSILFSVYVFPSFKYLPMIDFHRVYFAVNLSVSILLVMSVFLSINKSNRS